MFCQVLGESFGLRRGAGLGKADQFDERRDVDVGRRFVEQERRQTGGDVAQRRRAEAKRFLEPRESRGPRIELRRAAILQHVHDPIRERHAALAQRRGEPAELQMGVRIDESGDDDRVAVHDAAPRRNLLHGADGENPIALHDDAAALDGRPVDRNDPPSDMADDVAS